MHRKPLDKLQNIQTFIQLLGPLSVFFLVEDDLFLSDVQKPVNGDGTFQNQVRDKWWGCKEGEKRSEVVNYQNYFLGPIVFSVNSRNLTFKSDFLCLNINLFYGFNKNNKFFL